MHNQFADPKILNLADVFVRINTSADLSMARKAAIKSAINSTSRWFNLPPAAIPAHTEFLRRRFQRFSPAAVGATPRRVSTVKSEVLFGLRHLELASSGAYLVSLSPTWEQLWRRLPDKYARSCFSRFFRYCSAGNIDPRAVTDAMTASFLAALETETLVRQPRINHQNLCRVWESHDPHRPGLATGQAERTALCGPLYPGA